MQKQNRTVIAFERRQQQNNDEAHVLVRFPVEKIKDVPSVARLSDSQKVLRFQMMAHIITENPIRISFGKGGWQVADGIHRFLGAYGRNETHVPALIPIRSLPALISFPVQPVPVPIEFRREEYA
jgi:hypothetical protein